MTYHLDELILSIGRVSKEINGRWVPARPEPFGGLGGLRLRVRAAWLVLAGRADAVLWPGGQ